MQNSYNFCTIIDKGYLFKMLAFHHSLKKFAPGFRLWVCCADEESYAMLRQMQLDNVYIVHIGELGIDNHLLNELRNQRNAMEFCQTFKAASILHVLNHHDIPSLMFADADLFFFSSPQPILNEWGQYSIFICSDWSHPAQASHYGRYNSGFIGFKKDENAFNCLKWWNERCIEWCSLEGDGTRWADQKYLDQWPNLFSDVKIFTRLGVNAVPWDVALIGRKRQVCIQNGQIYIDGHYPLILYHFAGVRIFNECEFDMSRYPLDFNHQVIEPIYLPYFVVLNHVIKQVHAIDSHYCYGFAEKSGKIPLYYKYTDDQVSEFIRNRYL